MYTERLLSNSRRIGEIDALIARPRIQIGVRTETVLDTILDAVARRALELSEQEKHLTM